MNGNTLNQHGPAILNCRGQRAARQLTAACGTGPSPSARRPCRARAVCVAKHSEVIEGAAVEIRELLSSGSARAARYFETDVTPASGVTQTYEDRGIEHLAQVRHEAIARARFVTGGTCAYGGRA